MTEAEKRLHRVCFTGHRPEKLSEAESVVRTKLEDAIRSSVEDGYFVFISGMARGVDIWAAEIVLKEREHNPAIKLICASPYKGFEGSWSSDWQKRYNDIMNAADLIRFICPGYSRTCFQIRNEWMVDHSARLIAVYNGEKGGTRNTIKYAKKHNVDIIMIV